MSKHILDEDYRGHELVFIEQENGMITVDVRIDNFDGEFIAGYSDMLSVTDARNKAVGFVDGYHNSQQFNLLDLSNNLDTAFKDMDFSPLINQLKPKIQWCTECEGFYTEFDGRPYKYEPNRWMCDSCLDTAMEEA